MRTFAVVAVLTALAPAAPVPKALKKADDSSRLVGTWTAELQNKRGGLGSGHTFTFDADGTVRSQLGSGTPVEWTWTIEPGETPKRMRWVNKEKSDFTWQCVYELADDSFTIGFVTSGQAIPKTLEASGQLTVYHMTRVAVSK